MTPIAAAEDAGTVLALAVLVTPFTMTRATRSQECAEPYSRRWWRAGRCRRVSRMTAVGGYTIVALLYAVGGVAIFAVVWFVLMALMARTAWLNACDEQRYRTALRVYVCVSIAQLMEWHCVWNRWDALGRPTDGPEYDYLIANDTRRGK